MPDKVLIFGAGSGLGLALAEEYRRNGFETITPGRDECDLAVPGAMGLYLPSALARHGDISVCVYCAGVSEAGYVGDLDPGAYQRCFQVNFFSALAAFYGLARASRPCRRFVFVLSGAGDLLTPGYSPYALSKRALRDFLRVCSMERSLKDVRVLQVWPGGLRTDFGRKTKVHGTFRRLERTSGLRSPEDVAARIFEAERAGRERLRLSPLAAFLGRVQDALPGLAGLFLRAWDRGRKEL